MLMHIIVTTFMLLHIIVTTNWRGLRAVKAEVVGKGLGLGLAFGLG